jgi:hypothetical protein
MNGSQISPDRDRKQVPPVSKVTRKRTLRHAGVSSAIAIGVVATGVGVANASTHATSARTSTSATANAKRIHPSSMPTTPGAPCGIGGDVSAVSTTSITITDLRGTTSTYAINASTTVTKNGQSATVADIVNGDNVHIALSSTDPTLAGPIDIVPASVAGKVTAINGDVLTIAGPNGSTGSVVVSSTTTYAKGGASASLSDISVGTVIFAQGSFGSSATIVDATTVGIGQPSTGGPGAGPFGGGGPGGPPPGGGSPSFSPSSAMRGIGH